MKILVLTGSAHRNGTSALLAQRFIEGAVEKGHHVERFDAAFAKVHPCIGCDHCQCGKAPCVFQDDMAALYPKLREAELIVFVTPLYYHAMCAQLKAVVDRFHGIDDLLLGQPKAGLLMVTSADDNDHIMRGVVASFEEAMAYLKWQNRGTLLARGCNTRADIEKTNFPEQAYQLGKSL